MKKRFLSKKRMSAYERSFFYIPRVLVFLMICFFALFAFDMLDTGTFFEKIVGVLIQLIPSVILGVALWLSWRRGILGGFIFGVLSVVTVFFFKTYREVISFFIISFPIFIIAVLFVFHEFFFVRKLKIVPKKH